MAKAAEARVNFITILRYVGLILHVPGAMAILSLAIALIFREYYAIIPFATTAAISIGVGQLLFRLCSKHKQATLWDSMSIAALSWLLCPIVSAIPFYWICSLRLEYGFQSESAMALIHPINAFFEAFSGFTSSGLTLVKQPSEFSHSIIWWRSLTQWVGGVGLIVFILSVTEAAHGRYHLYYAETRTEVLGKTLKQTTRIIWGLYAFYTLCSILLFIIAGMPMWHAINNGMTGISTGGFTVADTSFADYSAAIKVAGIFVMLAGAISFVAHYELLKKRRFSIFWTSIPHRFLVGMFLIGGALSVWIDRITFNRWDWIDSVFTWTSAMTTCGFGVEDISGHAPMLKIFLIFAMLIGGAAGSTAGGIKIQRFLNLMSSLSIRMKSIFSVQASKQLSQVFADKDGDDEPGVILPHQEQTRKLFASGVLFFLWIVTLFLGWLFISYHVPHHKSENALFEVVSAMSNVGLTTDIVSPSLNPFCLLIFSLVMWLGRVEIIPAIVLLVSCFKVFKRSPSCTKHK